MHVLHVVCVYNMYMHVHSWVVETHITHHSLNVDRMCCEASLCLQSLA